MRVGISARSYAPFMKQCLLHKIRSLNEELELKVQERTQQLPAVQEEPVRKGKLALLVQVADTVGMKCAIRSG
jgi:hypothetical protein